MNDLSYEKRMKNKPNPIIHSLERAFNKYNAKGYFSFIPDSIVIRILFHLYFNRIINLKNPKTFNEKIQWLKLNDRKKIYNQMVDKFEAKKFVSKKIGEAHIIPTLGIWESFDEIDFSNLPDKFVLKCTHDSGDIVICKNKKNFNINKAKKRITKGLKTNFYLVTREWPYKDVPRKIIAEQYLENDESGGLIDYKIHCFNGVPKFILVCRDRFSESGLTEDFYTLEWELMSIKRPNIPNAKTPLTKPEKLDEMLALAKKLSDNIPFLRVDFYYINGEIYFSELTFYPASGFAPFEPDRWDRTFGDWLELPNK